jgi:hypothetical protein
LTVAVWNAVVVNRREDEKLPGWMEMPVGSDFDKRPLLPCC